MEEDLYAQRFQAALEAFCRGLPRILGNHHAAYKQADAPERIDQAEHVCVIGDANIPAHLALFDIACIYNDYDLHLVRKLQQHFHFAIRLKSRQYPGCVEIIKQLSAHFQIQLVVKMRDPLQNMLRLNLQIFFVVKPYCFHCLPSSSFPGPL